MWPFTRKNKNINPSHEQTATRYKWLGLELLSVLKQKDGRIVITARLVGKPGEYIGKRVEFNNRLYLVIGVEWGKSNKMVGLIVR